MRLAISVGPPTRDRAISNAFISHMVHGSFDVRKSMFDGDVSHIKQPDRHSSGMDKSRDRLLFAARELRGWDGPKEVSSKLTLAGYHVSTQMMGNWKNRGVPAEAAIAAARIIGCRAEWITNGDLPMSPLLLLGNAKGHGKQVSSDVQQVTLGRVPLISEEQAGMWNENIDIYRQGYVADWLPLVRKEDEHTFAVRVKGDSMAAPHGRSYPEGVIIVVDPLAKSPKSGARVLAKMANGLVTFKTFMNEDGRRWLKPLNPMHPPIFDDFQVIGTVTAKYEPDDD